MSTPYPPDRHVLRDLPFELEVVGPARHRASLERTGPTPVGAVLTVLDVLGGALCAATVAPDWMATSSLELHVVDTSGPGPLLMDATVLRAGRRSVTVEVDLHDGSARIGDAVLVFSRLPRREDNLALPPDAAPAGQRVRFDRSDAGEAPSWSDALGTAVVDPAAGRTETPLSPYLRNSFGALNGGVVAALAAQAAQLCAAEIDGRTVQLDDVVVHHLGQGRVGPVSTTARVSLEHAARVLVRVELRDHGAADEGGDGRLMAVARVGLSRPSARV